MLQRLAYDVIVVRCRHVIGTLVIIIDLHCIADDV